MRSLRRTARLQISARRFAFEITTITAGILIALSIDGIPTKSRPQDLEAFRVRVLDAIGAATIHKSLARALADEYRKAETR